MAFTKDLVSGSLKAETSSTLESLHKGQLLRGTDIKCTHQNSAHNCYIFILSYLY